MIARELQALGVQTTWWVSTFSHHSKSYVGQLGGQVHVLNGIDMRFLHGRSYEKNVSVARMVNSLQVAKDFARLARGAPKPDVIFCCYPTVDLAVEATRYGREHDVPVMIDVRDLWPEIFLQLTPVPKSLMRLILLPLYARARTALSNATALTAITEPFLKKALQLAGRAQNDLDGAVLQSYEKVILPQSVRERALRFWHAQGLKLDGSERIACFFGNLSGVVEYDTVIESLKHIDQQLAQRLRIAICGNGDKLEWLQNKAASRPELIVPGRINQAEISVLMDHADIGLLIYPRREDFNISYPNKVGEYLSHSLPILSTVDGLVGSLIRTNGIGAVVDVGDAKGFSEALETLMLDRSILAQMKSNANKVYDRQFDANVVYNALAKKLIILADGNR